MPPKYNPHASPIDKTMGLLSIFLFTQRAHSLGQLADILQCSKQSILRMVEHIQKSQWVTIDSWIVKRERWYQARIIKRQTNIVLDTAALEKLLLCKDVVWHLLPGVYRKEITEALQDAKKQQDTEEETLSDSFTQVKPKGYIDYTSRESFISDIVRAIRENKVVKIAYRAPMRKSNKSYLVAGHQMIVFREGLYLRGYRAETLKKEVPEEIILSVHRMHGVTITDTPFTPMIPEQDATEIAGTFGLHHGEPFRVKVQVCPSASMYVQERVWSSDQKIINHSDGSLTLEFSTTSEAETLAWVLSFGGTMQLLEPVALKQRIADAAKEIASDHED
jgi:predicted DNA-binding transcriptional regulator YafY